VPWAGRPRHRDRRARRRRSPRPSRSGPMSRPKTYSRGTSLERARAKARRISSLFAGVRVAEDPGLGATVEQVDGRPLPRQGAGQPRDLEHGQRRAHPRPALAHAACAVVDHQDSAHTGLPVGDADDLLETPAIAMRSNVSVCTSAPVAQTCWSADRPLHGRSCTPPAGTALSSSPSGTSSTGSFRLLSCMTPRLRWRSRLPMDPRSHTLRRNA
jgi:hypothetical protein